MLKAWEIIKKRNLPCFVHSLNLVMQESLALKEVKQVITKYKRIVTPYVKQKVPTR